MTRKRVIKLYNLGELPELGLMMELLKGKGSAALMAGTDLQEQTVSLEVADVDEETAMEEIQVDPSKTTASQSEEDQSEDISAGIITPQ